MAEFFVLCVCRLKSRYESETEAGKNDKELTLELPGVYVYTLLCDEIAKFYNL